MSYVAKAIHESGVLKPDRPLPPWVPSVRAGRVSAYKHEAQASGSLKAPKRSVQNAGLTCSRCVLVWGTRQRVSG